MKRIITLALVLLAVLAQAQNKAYPQPDFDNIPYYYDTVNNVLMDLERVQPGRVSRAAGLLKDQAALTFPGVNSPAVALKANGAQFMIRLSDSRQDPYSFCDLNACTINSNKAQREYVYQTKGIGSKTEAATVPLKFKKIGDGLYLITTVSPLPMGEYFFSTMISQTNLVYAFGLK